MTARAPTVELFSAERLRGIQELYDRGLTLQAYELGLQHAPLQFWWPVEAQVLAGRLAVLLGAQRLGMWLHRCAYRSAPESAEACYFYALSVFHRRGAYAAWRWMHSRELPGEPSADMLSSWFALLGQLSATLRDFETANAWMAKARVAAPDSCWVRVCEGSLREAEDRYDDALRVTQEALELKPWFRPAVQEAAQLLTLQGRDQEALQLLTEANARLENAGLAGQQFLIEFELRKFDAASLSLDRFESLSPLLEKRGRQWLEAQRADLAYQRGDIEAAIRHGRESDQDYWKTIAARLEDPEHTSAKKVLLPVGFVRQHHATCVPATLTAISHYWSMPVDHLQVAEEICYNGTSHYHERKWARDHGWIPREFSVTDKSAADLIDRGIPFTFTTIDPANAHLQAIVGYDNRRGTLSVRDPYFRNSGEALAEKLLERYRAHGPRGMLLVPEAEAARLDGVELPDAPLWDKLHELDGALDNHRREDAGALLQQMQSEAPVHRLTVEARRRLAIYDGNPTEQLAAVNELSTQFLDNQTLQYERVVLLRDHAQREERLAIYEELLARKDTHPIFWQLHAQELRCDARRHDDAIWRLRRAIRRWPGEPTNYHTLASIYWDHRRYEEALELYRFASCLGDKNEAFLESYFRAACWFKQGEQVLALLRDRVARFGKKSSRPVMSLASALVDLERPTDAVDALHEAIVTRPDDGELLVFAAELLFTANFENLGTAKDLMAKARPKSSRGQWLRAAAKLARAEGDLSEALSLWQQVLEFQPLAIDAHGQIVRLSAETKGTGEALEHLAQVANELPHYYPLHQLWVEWLRQEPASVREPVLRQVAQAFPHDAWIQRELGFFLVDERRHSEAQEVIQAAEQLEPSNPSLALLKAHFYRQASRLLEARHELEATIRLTVDNDFAIRGLIDLCTTSDERRTALELVKQELVRQVTFGEGLLSYRQHAHGTLEPAELLTLLQDALAARPDLWHAWSATIQQHLSMNQVDEAWSLVQEATERFPLMPRLWLDRAAVCRAQQKDDLELEALRAAYRINPRWNIAAQSLAECLERRGEYAPARELLGRAVARDPLDGMLRGLWAESLWRDGQRDAAVQHLEQLVQLDPGQERAWQMLAEWSAKLGFPEKAIQSVRELTKRRGGEARSWMMLARLLNKPEESGERNEAIDKAIELAPRNVDAHDMRAYALASEKRWDDGIAACEPAIFGKHPPLELRWRAAWIEVQRGSTVAAIGRLRELVSHEPQYFAAWSLLADCYAQLDDRDHYLEASEALVRISPQFEVAYGCLGESRQRKGDIQGAKEAYLRAFALNPKYEFAGNVLFDLQVEEGDLSAAAETIKVMRSHSEGHFVLAREARLATLLDDIPTASQIAARLAIATEPTQGSWPLREAIQSLVRAGHSTEAESVLEAAITKPEATLECADEWARLRVQLGRADWDSRLPDLLARNRPIGQRATYTYVEALMKANETSKLRRFISRNERWLKGNDFTWGAVAYALAGLRDYRATAHWASDWQGRSAAESWMLVNVVEGFRAVGRVDEAQRVGAVAQAKPLDHATALHNVWLASDAAADGDSATAARIMSGIECSALDAEYQFLATCVQAVIDTATAASDCRGNVFSDALRRLRSARRGYPQFPNEPARKRVFRHCVLQLGCLRGTWIAKLLCFAEWLASF